MATIRFFAAAADIIGANQLELNVSSVGEFRELIAAEYGSSAAKVVSRCSLLISGSRAQSDSQSILATDTVDVLPPFAGG